MVKKKNETDYAAALQEEFEDWNTLYTNGGTDPFYTDGVNLYLIRNHIIYYKLKIEETVQDGKYPEIYFKETPPEIDQNYMAKPDEIRKIAREMLRVFEKNENLQYIKRNIYKADEKFLQKNGIYNIINYETALKNAIKEDDLVTMRRLSNGSYLSSFATGAERLKQYVPPENSQISLFDLF